MFLLFCLGLSAISHYSTPVPAFRFKPSFLGAFHSNQAAIEQLNFLQQFVRAIRAFVAKTSYLDC
jgi:hypothetical protein